MNQSRPPQLFIRFLKWYCKGHLLESILGDLEEQFDEDHEAKGLMLAKSRFVWNVIRFCRPGIIKSLGGTQKLNYYGMFKHILQITLRGFKRHKTVFSINLVGLIASLTCVLFSAIWINDELKKDRFHDESEKLFQVYTKFHSSDGTSVWRGVTGLLEKEIENQIPQASMAAVSTDVHEYTLSVENKGVKKYGRFADADYLRLLNYPLLEGNVSALEDPSNILITESMAKQLFGDKEAMGQSINWHFWSGEKTFQVAGILKDVTPESSESFEFILPWTFYHDELITYKGWGNFYGRVLVKLVEVPQQKQVESQINEIFQANQENENVELFLTNFSDQYLYGNYQDGVQAGGRIDYVKLTAVVALFILIIACINFINLSTAFSSLKKKEIGVKKTFGASKNSLAFQFFFESILMACIALCIAIGIVFLLIEPFNQLTGKQLMVPIEPSYLGFAFLFIPFIGLIAGLYPAIYLSNLGAISALKAKLTPRRGGGYGRQVLVLVQFSLSIILIVGTLVVRQQMEYALNKNLGYDRDNLVYFLREGKLLTEDKAFAAELESLPEIREVSRSSFSVGPDMQNRTGGVNWEGKGEDEQVQFWENNGDAKSIDILNLELVAGRSFDDQLHSEENSVIFNETAIRLMGMENPIGQEVEHYTGKKKIIGVVKDFTTESLHNPMEPAMFFYRPERAHYVLVKLSEESELQALEKLESIYKKFNPNYPFEPKFIDQDYQAMYDADMRVSSLSKLFSGLAILISCMGLFGLTIFQIQRKMKEIGIKKVLGCSSSKLAFSMTYNFTKTVLLALIIALPISYFLSQKWLENFADSTQLSWGMLLMSAVFAILISWVTVGSQTVKAANSNPIDALRDE